MTTIADLYEFDLHRDAVLRRMGWSLLGAAIVRSKGLLSLPLALWILGAAGYGEVTLVVTTAAAVAPLALLNIPDGAARLVVSAPSPAIAAKRLAAIRTVGIAVAIVVVGVGGAVGLALGADVVAWSALVAAGSIVYKLGIAPLEYFQKTSRLVRFQIAAEYLAVATGLAAALKFGVPGFVVMNFLMLTAVGLVAWRAAPTVRVTTADPGFWRAALRLSLPLLPVSFAQWALFSVDALLVFVMVGAGATGAYSTAYSLASVALVAPLAVNAVWFPTAQRLLARSRDALWRFFISLLNLLGIAALALWLLSLAVRPLIGGVLEEPVFALVPAAVSWIVIGFVALAACKLAEGVLYAFARPLPILGCYCAGAVVNVLLNLVWIPRYDILGAAYATAAGYGFTALLLTSWAVALGRKRA